MTALKHILTYNGARKISHTSEFIGANMIVVDRYAGTHGADRNDYNLIQDLMMLKDHVKYRNNRRRLHRKWAGIS
jgi:hypothetical protein